MMLGWIEAKMVLELETENPGMTLLFIAFKS